MTADFEARAAVTEEAVRALRVLWSDEQPSFEGVHVNLEPVWFEPKPPQANFYPADATRARDRCNHCRTWHIIEPNERPVRWNARLDD